MTGLARLFLALSCPVVDVTSAYVTTGDCVGRLDVPVVDFPKRIEGMPLSPVTIAPVTLIEADELETRRKVGHVRRLQIRFLNQDGIM